MIIPDSILSFYVSEISGTIGVSMINSNGKEVYKNYLEHFFSAHPSVKEKREFEIKNIFDFIRNRQPYVIAVSSNSSRAITLKANLF